MKQLGTSFIGSFLLPYLQNQILGNIENDTRLQNMFRYDRVLRPEELGNLEEDYFKNTGTILETDMDLRRAFWKEFTEFVRRQKNLCEGNVLKLAFRLLPDARTGSFSKEAEQNLQKFAYYAVNRLEDTLVQREIDQKKVLGKISSAKAADDNKDLKDGKMILVRQKDGKFDYMSDKEISSAIGNVERTARLLSFLQIDETEKGEKKAYTFNPLEISQGDKETSSSPLEIQNLLWNKQSIKSEKQLEDNGIFVESHMTVDANGISSGFAKDKNGIRLRIEFDVKKPGERVYRISFVDNPDNKFFIPENELKKKFGEKKQSALEIFREKEGDFDKTEGVAKMKGTKLAGGAGRVNLPANRKIVLGASGTQTQAPPEEGMAFGGYPYVPPSMTQPKKHTTNAAETERQRNLEFSGAIDAKRALAERNKNFGSKEVDTTASVNGRDSKANRGKLKASRNKDQKSFMVQVAKIYAAGFGGALGLSGLVSLLT